MFAGVLMIPLRILGMISSQLVSKPFKEDYTKGIAPIQPLP
jgi:hypothetical protein